MPVDSSQGVAAAGLDRSVAIGPGIESGSQSDVQWNRDWQRSGRVFGQTPIDDCDERGRLKLQSQDFCIWVDQNWNFAGLQGRQKPFRFHQPRGDTLDGMLAFIHRFCESDRAADRQRLFKLSDNHVKSGAKQTKCNARCKVAATAQKDEG